MNAFEKQKRKIEALAPDIHVTRERGCTVLRGTAESWDTIVRAGRMAVDRRHSLGVINDVRLAGFTQQPYVPPVQDALYDGAHPDVLVIGGGITGSAILRELSRYELSAMLVERNADVACGASSRNGGVVHVGINFPKNSQKHLYNNRGNAMYRKLAADLDVPFEQKGQVMLACRPWERLAAFVLCLNAKRLGIPGVRYLKREKLLSVEPYAPDWAIGGVYMPTGGITCPHRMTVALAENAVLNGATVALNTAVQSMCVENGRIVSVTTNRGTIYPRIVINAAGVYADKIADMAGDRTFTIHPRKGTDIITDTKYGYRVRTSFAKAPYTVLPYQRSQMPKGFVKKIRFLLDSLHSHTKGVGVIHSVDGNMLVGPNATETPDREDVSTERAIFDDIMHMQQHVTEELRFSDVIAYFTGVRAPTYEEDFVVRRGVFTGNIIEAAGIQSPGVTAAPAIAEDVARWAAEMLQLGSPVIKKKAFIETQKSAPRLRDLPDEERDALIAQNPDYGEIICRCEQISRGEILDVLRSPLPVYTLDGVKRRIRPGMGRCQGGFCSPLVTELIAKERGVCVPEVEKGNPGSWITAANTKSPLQPPAKQPILPLTSE